MARRTKAQTDIMITAAATLFALHTRDADEIAALLNSSKSSVYRWRKSPLWTEVLDALNYEGEMHFRVMPARDADRENAEELEIVEAAYQQAKQDGIPKSKISRQVAEQTGVKYWKVREMARKYGWDT